MEEKISSGVVNESLNESRVNAQQFGKNLLQNFSSYRISPLFATFTVIIVGLISYLISDYHMSRNNKAQTQQAIAVSPAPTLPLSVTKTAYETIEKPIVELNAESEYIVRGSKIVMRYQNHETEIFTNVKDVTEVKIGPDGETLHFRTPENKYGVYCVHTDSLLIDRDDLEKDALAEIWDYSLLGHSNGPDICQSNSGGYLKESPFFAYITLDLSGKALLHMQNLDTKESYSFELDNIVSEKFNTMTGTPESSGLGLYADSVDGVPFELEAANPGSYELIADKSNMRYLYPQHDSHIVNGKMLLSFGDVFIGVDQKNKKAIGSVDLRDFNAASIEYSYLLHSSEKAPIAVIETFWEGPSNHEGLIDFSSDKVKFVPFEGKFDTENWSYFVNDPVEWRQDKVVIHKEKYEHINLPALDKLTQDEIEENDQKAQERGKQLTAQYMKSGKYRKILCYVRESMFGPPYCMGYLGDTLYEYKIGGNVIMIN